ncbi:MAG: lipase family protein [Caulobacterales bacterium]
MTIVNQRVGCICAVAAVALIALGLPPAAAQEGLKSVAQAIALEAKDALPITPFYDPPKGLSSTKPGALLRQGAFDGYALPAGARAIRILYHSRSAEGLDVATSAVVLIPAGPTPAGGWPVIAWAHGTSGVARQCAPSLMKDVYYGDEGLMPMVRSGYAVVATDYHGLGTPGTHQYVSKPAQAYDVVYSVVAARAAVPSLGDRWVVDGHSQGGLAAWGVAELEHARRDPGYLGAVAVAPASQLREVLTRPRTSTAASFYLEYLAWAIHARTASFKAADMLTGAALARYSDVTSNGCFYYAYASFLGDTKPPVLKAGWNDTPAARRFFRDNEIGATRIGGPLLVLAGEADQTVPIATVRTTVKNACARGVALELRTYPGLDHDPTMENSTPDQLAWIADRFAGKPSGNDCARTAGTP